MKRYVPWVVIIGCVIAGVVGVIVWKSGPGGGGGPGGMPGTRIAVVYPVMVDAFQRFQEKLVGTVAPGGATVTHYSAEGDASKFDSIIEQALRDKPDILVTVGTQLTNTAFGPQFKDRLPVLIASCVGAPDKVEALVDVGVAPPRNRNVAIISDSPEVDIYSQSAELIARLLPPAAKVGIIFNPGELNSLNNADGLTAALKQKGLEVEPGRIGGVSDVAPVTEALLRKSVSLLIIPHDKAATSEAGSIVKLGMERPTGAVPVFSLEDGAVRTHGAAIAVSVDYGSLGSLTGENCNKILGGASAAGMPVQRQKGAMIYVNKETLKKCGIPIDAPFLKGAIVY